MLITNDTINGFINCRYKAYLKARRDFGTISDYQLLYQQLKNLQIDKYRSLHKHQEIVVNNGTSPDTFKMGSLVFDCAFSNSEIAIVIDAIEVTGTKTVMPVFFTPLEKITTNDKLYIFLQTILIQTHFALDTEFCRIISGSNFKITKYKVATFSKTALKSIKEFRKFLSSVSPPIFYRNKHCAVCEFNTHCSKKLVERDDLSLLGAMKPRDIIKRNERGIFSVTQLSYLFRQKKNPLQKNRFSYELKALAIREQKTFIQEAPNFRNVTTEVYLDIEEFLIEIVTI